MEIINKKMRLKAKQGRREHLLGDSKDILSLQDKLQSVFFYNFD